LAQMADLPNKLSLAASGSTEDDGEPLSWWFLCDYSVVSPL